ncbi:MAG: Gfo/Idh/MocA family oxidoreductase [Candidatus Promineifilaceae bacterium]|nr:Gfo/Idh/MocA family oxidoreductase [Candidatus Promineifilaceae bacterium]
MTQPLTAVLLGAGLRGADAYGPYALAFPDELNFVAVAEPDPIRRKRFAAAHEIPSEQQFATWEEVLALPQIADAVFNCTMDHMHYNSGMAALDQGYSMLLEKPMANSLSETVDLVNAAEENGRLLQICHVLRYTPFFSTLHDILQSGRLGDIVTVEHRENVAFWHMAHSFVRGNWRSELQSSPMILAKCCHDLDLLIWNLQVPVKRLQSFGSLRHFRAENAPEGAARRCTDNCPAAVTCPFDARRIYLNMYNEGWPVSAISSDLSLEGRQHALAHGPYGRCVYFTDNSVVDNQTVNMEFADGTTVVLFMNGHSYQEGRTMRYDGTRATLRGTFMGEIGAIEIHDHLTGRREEIDIPATDGTGHGGGDFGVVRSFVEAMNGREQAMTDARTSLESHLMAFAAEHSRHNYIVVDMDIFRSQAVGG